MENLEESTAVKLNDFLIHKLNRVIAAPCHIHCFFQRKTFFSSSKDCSLLIFSVTQTAVMNGYVEFTLKEACSRCKFAKLIMIWSLRGDKHLLFLSLLLDLSFFFAARFLVFRVHSSSFSVGFETQNDDAMVNKEQDLWSASCQHF
jgi:hypothetical protein